MENLAHQLLAPNAPNRIAAITCLKRYVDSHPNSQAALAIIGQLGGRTKAAYDAGRGVDGEAFERDMDTLVRLAENERLMFEIFGLLCSFKERLEGMMWS